MNTTVIAQAPEPSRSTGSVTVSFGLLSIPVSLYTATRSTRTVRHEHVVVDGQYHPVGRQSYDKVTGEPVDRAEVIKTVEVGDVLVPVTDEAYANATGADALAGRLDLEATLPAADLPLRFVPEGTTYQVRPQKAKKAGAAAGGERALALLLAALDEAGVVAIGRTALRAPRCAWWPWTPQEPSRCCARSTRCARPEPCPP